ncbi:unnamed protein product, partial [Effrenium voratum]
WNLLCGGQAQNFAGVGRSLSPVSEGNREDECREQAFRELAARVEVLEERSRWPLREARELEQRSLEAMDQVQRRAQGALAKLARRLREAGRGVETEAWNRFDQHARDGFGFLWGMHEHQV